ncbi:G2/M phase-specific E3 ubiquitin-protein ligase-like isoform X2 [Anneissia japonica]|uniref:G2/M phase-specific E3 ubiquitin-protein ligase-like isoform X2 n=1 Tax=Anneissia japonica TaxID=1529436 RepID=UPI001425B4E8|nr:G2/M phase-specific E3 ubiquitin-protein ligase-like isoform X2 [Anneissia japonica]
MKIKFTDSIGQTEGAIDVGGPRREFFSLVLNHIQHSSLFEGPPTSRVLSLGGQAMENDHYYYAGQLMAMSLVHGGPSPTFLSTTLYEAIAYGCERSTAGLDDVGDLDIKSKLMKIQSATSLEELQGAADEAEDFLSLAGLITNINSVDKKNQLVSSAVRFYVLDRTRSAFERLLSGLETLGVLNTIKENPVACRKAFIHSEESELISERLKTIFHVDFSEKGSNKRSTEEVVLSQFFDYLIDVEEGETKCTLRDILVFTSGASSIPITSFTEMPEITFLHSADNYPTANTCSIVLRLPTVHKEYEAFKEAMDFAILNSQSFGTS